LAGPTLDAFFNENEDDVSVIVVHFPGFEDPWFLRDTTVHEARRAYYNVQGTPLCWVDGSILVHPEESTELDSAFDIRSIIESPLSIDIDITGGSGDPIEAGITVSSEDEAVEGNYSLRVALLQTISHYDSPNGQMVWHYDLLHMDPDEDGFDFQIEANDTQEFYAEFEWDDDYFDLRYFTIAAYVQDDETGEITQSQIENVINYYDFSFVSDTTASLVPPGTATEFNFTLNNSGSEADEYNIEIESNMSDGWEFSYSTPDGDETEDSVIPLDGLSTYTGSVSFIPSDNYGEQGSVTMTVSSEARPEIGEIEIKFEVVQYATILIMNGDEEGINSEYYTDAIDVAEPPEPVTRSVWTKSEYGINLDEWIEADPEVIMWYTGQVSEIEENEIEYLTNYVEGGGKLFISGELMPPQLRDSDLIELMGTNYGGYWRNADHVYGVDDDPVGDGLSFDLTDGDGANNIYRPRYLDVPADDAVAFMHFDEEDEKICGVYNNAEDYKTMIFAFPFETISTADDRNEVMNRILNFFYPRFPPSAFSLVSPEDETTFSVDDLNDLVFSWEESIDPDSGEVVAYDLHVEVYTEEYTDMSLNFSALNTTDLTVNLADSFDFEYWEEYMEVEWWVKAISDQDTVHSNNNFTFLIEPYSSAGDMDQGGMPEKYSLSSPYPNPFNPSTSIILALPASARVDVRVYNILGEEVAILAEGVIQPGYHTLSFDGRGMSSGIYFIRAAIQGKLLEMKKLILMK